MDLHIKNGGSFRSFFCMFTRGYISRHTTRNTNLARNRNTALYLGDGSSQPRLVPFLARSGPARGETYGWEVLMVKQWMM